jgi:hypothetical protein
MLAIFLRGFLHDVCCDKSVSSSTRPGNVTSSAGDSSAPSRQKSHTSKRQLQRALSSRGSQAGLANLKSPENQRVMFPSCKSQKLITVGPQTESPCSGFSVPALPQRQRSWALNLIRCGSSLSQPLLATRSAVLTAQAPAGSVSLLCFLASCSVCPQLLSGFLQPPPGISVRASSFRSLSSWWISRTH